VRAAISVGACPGRARPDTAAQSSPQRQIRPPSGCEPQVLAVSLAVRYLAGCTREGLTGLTAIAQREARRLLEEVGVTARVHWYEVERLLRELAAYLRTV
jgi:hypothetical protein